jgi:CheY-like chemotaxis protein
MACILFVDDDPFTLETLNKAVQIFGHQALLASSGEQALALAVDHPPDLIMTDMMLPDMNGLTLINRLRQEETIAQIPVIMLSASPEIDVASISLEAGAEAYLNKPVRLQSLLDIIQRYSPEK